LFFGLWTLDPTSNSQSESEKRETSMAPKQPQPSALGVVGGLPPSVVVGRG